MEEMNKSRNAVIESMLLETKNLLSIGTTDESIGDGAYDSKGMEAYRYKKMDAETFSWAGLKFLFHSMLINTDLSGKNR